MDNVGVPGEEASSFFWFFLVFYFFFLSFLFFFFIWSIGRRMKRRVRFGKVR